MEKKPKENKDISVSSKEVPAECPHCGIKLSPWQQVLLRVDRILTCRNCWYRIILTVQPDNQAENNSETPEKE